MASLRFIVAFVAITGLLTMAYIHQQREYSARIDATFRHDQRTKILSTEVDDLKSTLTAVRTELTNTKRLLRHTEARNGDLERQGTSARESAQNLTRALVNLQQAMAESKADVDGLKLEANRLQGDYDKTNLALETCHREKDDIADRTKKHAESLSQEVTKLVGDLKSCRSELKNEQSAKESLEAQFKAKHDALVSAVVGAAQQGKGDSKNNNKNNNNTTQEPQRNSTSVVSSPPSVADSTAAATTLPQSSVPPTTQPPSRGEFEVDTE
eukprot:PhM_4_TR5940/c0_g1_i1/m.1108